MDKKERENSPRLSKALKLVLGLHIWKYVSVAYIARMYFPAKGRMQIQ